MHTGELNVEKKVSKQRIKGRETKVLSWEEVCLVGGSQKAASVTRA